MCTIGRGMRFQRGIRLHISSQKRRIESRIYERPGYHHINYSIARLQAHLELLHVEGHLDTALGGALLHSREALNYHLHESWGVDPSVSPISSLPCGLPAHSPYRAFLAKAGILFQTKVAGIPKCAVASSMTFALGPHPPMHLSHIHLCRTFMPVVIALSISTRRMSSGIICSSSDLSRSKKVLQGEGSQENTSARGTS